MLSGNGRHRRPRQAPALVVAVGVAGSAIAIPLLGATSAHAADTAAWDRLADCESGGSWSADPGNGFYGGLQFSQESWEDYGGLDYAPRADQASRAQQIAVAEKVLADQGPGAWPACSLIAGLTKGDDEANVDPGVPEDSGDPSGDPDATTGADAGGSTTSDGSSGSSGSTTSDDPTASDGSGTSGSSGSSGDSGDSRGSHDSGDTDGSSATGGSDGSGRSTGSRGDDSGESDNSRDRGKTGDSAGGSDDAGRDGSGRHRGGADGDGTSDGRSGDSGGRHTSRGDAGRDSGAGSYTVRPGDSLWAIADTHDVDGGWAALYDGNKGAVGSDPDLILPGQKLDLSPESGQNRR